MSNTMRYTGNEPIRLATDQGLRLVGPGDVLSDLSEATVAGLAGRTDFQVEESDGGDPEHGTMTDTTQTEEQQT